MSERRHLAELAMMLFSRRYAGTKRGQPENDDFVEMEIFVGGEGSKNCSCDRTF